MLPFLAFVQNPLDLALQWRKPLQMPSGKERTGKHCKTGKNITVTYTFTFMFMFSFMKHFNSVQ